MLEKPKIKDEKIIACLKREFGLRVAEITFLPLGADLHTAVYRVVTVDNTPYFLKLRGGEFDKAFVAVPRFLHNQGMEQIIPSQTTAKGQLWANLDSYAVIVYPFVEGNDGYEVNLTDQQRIEFGAALKRFHSAEIPLEITKGIHRDTFSPKWREKVKKFLDRIENETFVESVAAELVDFLKVRSNETLELIKRAEQHALSLRSHPREFILCHGDIHAWNLLIREDGDLYIVDWDTLIFAPKERDLMFVGGGLGGNGHTLEEEVTLFYQGYGQTQIDPIAMAYYRYERIIEDIAVDSEMIISSVDGGEDRVQALAYIKSNYVPNGTIEIAYQTDKIL